MLGYVMAEGRGEADLLIQGVATRLRDAGTNVVGAVQVNLDIEPETKCHMDLHILSGDSVVRISQNLGALSRGCRLDPDGLERAVGLVAAGLQDGAQILIVNKFGKQEADGRGFRPLIGEAISAGIPVLTAVGQGNLAAFLDYAQDLAHPVPADADALFDWAMAVRADADPGRV